MGICPMQEPIAAQGWEYTNNITSFYGSSCANNGKDALSIPGVYQEYTNLPSTGANHKFTTRLSSRTDPRFR
eukprot:1608652-Pyramimonas_sp.AAC.2